ncbi:MAG: YdbH domain-containing protein [Deltaproteobacteria bacterium]
MAKKFFFILGIAIFLFFAFRNVVVKKILCAFVKNEFGSECKITGLNISLSGIRADNLLIVEKDAEISLGKITVAFDFSRLPQLNIAGADLESGKIRIQNLSALIRRLSGKLSKPKNAPVFFTAHNPYLNLKDIAIEIKNLSGMQVQANFSLSVRLEEGNAVSIVDASIPDFNLTAANFEINHLKLQKTSGVSYNLDIAAFKVKSKEVKNIDIPIRLEPDQVIFPRAQNVFLGPEAFMEGYLKLGGFRNPYLYLTADGISFINFIDLVAEPGSIDLGGRFGGKITVSVKSGKFDIIQGQFVNDTSGFIHIKNELALDFLRKYLDAQSYKALVDNFRNYAYNKSVIIIYRRKDDLSLIIHFESADMGNKNIPFYFHNLLGGVK